MLYLNGYRLSPMKTNFSFQIGNRGLLQEELGLADRVNTSLRASAIKHGVELKPGVMVVKVVRSHNGKILRRVSGEGKEPVDVPLAAA
jgi:hypothetical protein